LIEKAIELFTGVRRSGITKPPSTSELLDWMRVLLDFSSKPYAAAELPETVTASLPFPEVLCKLRTDWLRLVGDA